MNAWKHGHHHTLTSTDLLFICKLLNQQHTIYLDEIQEQLFLCHGAKVSLTTLTHNSSSLIRTFWARLWSTMIICMWSTWITSQILCLTWKFGCLVMRHTKMREHLIEKWGGSHRGARYVWRKCFIGGKSSQSKFYIIVGWKYEDKLLVFLCHRLLYLAFGTLWGWIDSKLSKVSMLSGSSSSWCSGDSDMVWLLKNKLKAFRVLTLHFQMDTTSKNFSDEFHR